MVMERVVMPILDEFKPELIINSAGQDNHYTDPITNMNFTAQGYARLNRRLNPDICVLEGGYSIEGALPYTNLGIILAMAGMDYSHVKEPDYDQARFRQPEEMSQYIAGVCDKALEVFANRGRTKKEALKKKVVSERKSIFYDTTGFNVDETRQYHLCPTAPAIPRSPPPAPGPGSTPSPSPSTPARPASARAESLQCGPAGSPDHHRPAGPGRRYLRDQITPIAYRLTPNCPATPVPRLRGTAST